MLLEAKKLAMECGVKSPDLITRPVGKRLYARAQKLLPSIFDGDTLHIDFRGIMVIDPSFIDEFLVKLLLDARRESPKFFPRLVNITEIFELNAASVFQSYQSFSNIKLAVITDQLMSNNSNFIGPLEPFEKDILDYIRINKRVRPFDIAEFLKIGASRAHEILNGLYAMRLVRLEIFHDSPFYADI